MGASPRETVKRCLTFSNPERIPRQLWFLPWAESHFPNELRQLQSRFPDDIITAPDINKPSPRVKGDPYKIGTHVDRWGCIFTNIQEGVIGEVRTPLLKEIGDWRSVKPPYEMLPDDAVSARDTVNRFCSQTDKFVQAAVNPRPWEQFQFMRGTENAMIDLMLNEDDLKKLLRVMQDFYMKELEFWVTTDVDGIPFMDDWGSQRQLLIPPEKWRMLFKPLYKEYCDIAHAHNKFIFMHSDGYIMDIYRDLVEIGVDAINSQLFCMDMALLAKDAKGKITFWGEIDRQHVLPSPDPEKGREAVRLVARHLYDPRGGIIAQFELSPGSNPKTAMAIFEEWEKIQRE